MTENGADVLDTLPDAGTEEISFEASLESALAGLDMQEVPETGESETEAVEEADDDGDDGDEVVEEPVEHLTEDIGDDWTPKAANRFKQLKIELKNSKSELDQLRQKTTEYESRIQELTGLVENKDIEQLQQKLAEYEQKQMFSNLEETTAYKQAVVEPLAALMSQADQIAEKYEIDSDTLIDVLALDNPEEQEAQLAELLPHASDRDKAKLFRIMEEVDPILERRSQLFQNAEQALAEAKHLEEQRQTAEAAQQARLRQNVTRNVVERVKQKLPFLVAVENLDFDTIQTKVASSDPAVLHPVDHAFNAISAQLLPTVVREYVSLRKEVELLTDRLADYENAEPSMSGASKDSSASLSSDASFADRVNAALAGIR